jgi:septum formation protein
MQNFQERKLILASTSPYRRELLARLRVPFATEAPGVEEQALPGETPLAMAQRLALAKARAVSLRHLSHVVIGSDQVADLNGVALGKPGSFASGLAQLAQMSGQSVTFHTAVAVVCAGSGFCAETLASVRVKFRVLERSEIECYLRLEEPYDCAGSAKSEGLGIALLESIASDDPTALVGLPLIRTSELLRQAGIAILGRRYASA